MSNVRASAWYVALRTLVAIMLAGSGIMKVVLPAAKDALLHGVAAQAIGVCEVAFAIAMICGYVVLPCVVALGVAGTGIIVFMAYPTFECGCLGSVSLKNPWARMCVSNMLAMSAAALLWLHYHRVTKA